MKHKTFDYFITYCFVYITAAVEVTTVLVKVLPSDGHGIVIPVVLQLEDDKIIEPTDLYQLMIVNFSDPRAVAGDVSISYVIINDDDDRKLVHKNMHTTLFITNP